VPKRFRPTLHKLVFGGIIAIGVVILGLSAWAGFKQGPRAASAVVWTAIATAGAAYGILGLWLAPLLDDRPVSLRELATRPKRMQRLLELLELLPEKTPPGWVGPINLKPTAGSWTAFWNGAVIIAYFVDDEPPARHFFVTLASKDAANLSDDRAAETLAHFRGIGPFMEMESTPDALTERFPHTRTWVALPYETIKKMPIPATRPAILDTPLNAHLRAVREHLPAKLPMGWSVPIAVPEGPDDYEGDGAWLVDEDDAAIIVQLVTSEGRTKLYVTIFHPGGEPVSEARAHGILVHFRGVSEFVQREDDGSIKGARTFLGEIEGRAGESIVH
jgi:hypothetical protein